MPIKEAILLVVLTGRLIAFQAKCQPVCNVRDRVDSGRTFSALPTYRRADYLQSSERSHR